MSIVNGSQITAMTKQTARPTANRLPVTRHNTNPKNECQKDLVNKNCWHNNPLTHFKSKLRYSNENRKNGREREKKPRQWKLHPWYLHWRANGEDHLVAGVNRLVSWTGSATEVHPHGSSRFRTLFGNFISESPRPNLRLVEGVYSYTWQLRLTHSQFANLLFLFATIYRYRFAVFRWPRQLLK